MKNIFHFLIVNIYHRILLSFDNCFAEFQFQFFLKKNFTFSIVSFLTQVFFEDDLFVSITLLSIINFCYNFKIINDIINTMTTTNKQTKLILIYNHVILVFVVVVVVVRNKEILTHPQNIVYFDVRKSSRYIFCLARLRLVGYHSFCRFVFSFFFTS